MQKDTKNTQNIPQELPPNPKHKNRNHILYNLKNSASPDASDPPVPNRAYTEM